MLQSTLVKPYLRRPRTGRARGRSGSGSRPTSLISAAAAAAAKDLVIWWGRHQTAEYIHRTIFMRFARV